MVPFLHVSTHKAPYTASTSSVFERKILTRNINLYCSVLCLRKFQEKKVMIEMLNSRTSVTQTLRSA